MSSAQESVQQEESLSKDAWWKGKDLKERVNSVNQLKSAH